MTQLIEQSAIDHLLGLGKRSQDDSFLGSVIALYLEQLPALLDGIDRAVASADRGSLKRVAHRIKGSSLSVGASVLARECQAMEKLTEQDPLDVPKALTLASQLRATCDATSAELKQLPARYSSNL